MAAEGTVIAVDDEVRELYGRPIDEFIAARDELAKARKAAGDAAGAKDVKARRKPSVPAWALDQVARRQPDLIDALLASGARVRAASAQALGGDRSALKDATTALQTAIATVADAAAVVLHEVGRAPTQPTRERLSATARAAATDEVVGAALRDGILDADADPAGFGLDGLEFTPAPPAPPPPPDERRRDAQAAVERARTRVAQTDEDVFEAEHRLAAARLRQADANAKLAECEAALAALAALDD